MFQIISKDIQDILACPSCKTKLALTDDSAVCSTCRISYDRTEWGALDLRPKVPLSTIIKFNLYHESASFKDHKYEPLLLNPEPNMDLLGVVAPHHLSREILSYFPAAGSSTALALDLGCGAGHHRNVIEHCGFEYIGLDFSTKEATLLGDAHALPFLDNSIDFVLSIAVLEHIRYPFVMMREVNRVLKKNKLFIGTVAFLEPFHADSFYHHTHLGIQNMLEFGGFNIESISPSETWTVLTAQEKALFPGMPWNLSRIIFSPVQFLRRIWWRLYKMVKPQTDLNQFIRDTTGAFTFIAINNDN